MEKRGFLSVLLLCFVTLLYLSTSLRSVSSEGKNSLKVTEELKATISAIRPNDTLLVWLDIYLPCLPDGNVYLSSRDLSPVTDCGARIAGITFSPNGQLLWYLAEVCTRDIPSLANLSMVRNVSLAMIGAWEWWSKPWRNVMSCDPLLNLTARRVANDFPDTSLRVVMNYAITSSDQTETTKQQMSSKVSKLVNSVGGNVTRIGLAEYVLADIPLNELGQLSKSEYIRTIEASRPLHLRGGSFKKLKKSHSEVLLMIFPMFLCAAFYSMRKLRKLKPILIALLLFTVCLLSYDIPSTYALPISRRAINADQTSYNGDNIVVAVIDTGIDFNHIDLSDAILTTIDMTGGHDPMDYSGHGTHVAGIVAGQSEICTGIAPGAKLISLKVDTPQSMEDAIQWCIDNQPLYDIQVIQLSMGLDEELPGHDGMDSFSMKADEAVEAGIVVVVAVNGYDWSGNGKLELSSPEQAYNVIAVGATSHEFTVDIDDDEIVWFSSSGETMGGRPKPDVLAPGCRTDDPLFGIWSTRSDQANESYYEDVNGIYGRLSGTSMAAPHVSGTVALMLQANPDLTPAQVKAILKQTARLNDNLTELDINERGHGIIDAFEAVQMAQNTGDIQIDYMYDSWEVITPKRWVGGWEHLAFTVEPPLLDLGISFADVKYLFQYPTNEYEIIQRMSAQHVWISDTYYNLGNNMTNYLFTGPRIYSKSDTSSSVSMRAVFKVNDIFIVYDWFMGVDRIKPALFFLGGLQTRTLMYIDANIRDSTDYPYLPMTEETVLIETEKIGDTPLVVRNPGTPEYIQFDPPQGADCAMWALRDGYHGNNPNSASVKNDEYVYNRDIAIYYQEASEMPGLDIHRKTDFLPYPDNTQNDAGKGQDAGNNFNTATSISPGSYEGILCNSDPYDTEDWYQFYAANGKIISLAMTPPYGVNFDLELYSPDNQQTPKAGSYNGPGHSDGIVYTADSSGNWRARIYISTGEAQYSLSVSVYSSGGGCPFVYVWNGTRFIIDNNLLPTSTLSNGEEVEDYYKLEQSLVPSHEGDCYSLYSLRLSEFQQEHSYLEQMQFITVDHNSAINVAVSPFGEILTYEDPYAPFSAIDNQGHDQVELIREIDDFYYEGYNGSYLLLNFSLVEGEIAKLVMRADPPPQKQSIHIQVLDAGNWTEVVEIIPRTYWATEIIDLSSYLPNSTEEFNVRLYFTDYHRVDFIGLDTTAQAEIDVEQALLLMAYHSEDGLVTSRLRTDNDVYAELTPGQQITLLFTATTQDGEQRTFIIYVKGYYITIDN